MVRGLMQPSAQTVRQRPGISLRRDSDISVPKEPGTYILILEAPARRRIPVGALGMLVLEPGFYAYVGSALGSGGLRGRLAHHRGRARSPHWHIDYVRRHTALREIWFSAGALRREHGWAAALARSDGSIIPQAGFGASDCGCRSHLFRFSQRPRLSAFRRQLEAFASQAAGASGAVPTDFDDKLCVAFERR
jgi:Uri superfamily endonuclease